MSSINSESLQESVGVRRWAHDDAMGPPDSLVSLLGTLTFGLVAAVVVGVGIYLSAGIH